MHPTETTNEDFGSYWVRLIFNGPNNFSVLHTDNGAIFSVLGVLCLSCSWDALICQTPPLAGTRFTHGERQLPPNF